MLTLQLKVPQFRFVSSHASRYKVRCCGKEFLCNFYLKAQRSIFYVLLIHSHRTKCQNLGACGSLAEVV